MERCYICNAITYSGDTCGGCALQLEIERMTDERERFGCSCDHPSYSFGWQPDLPTTHENDCGGHYLERGEVPLLAYAFIEGVETYAYAFA